MSIYKYFSSDKEYSSISKETAANYVRLPEIFPKIVNSHEDHFLLSILLSVFLNMDNNDISFNKSELVKHFVKDILPRTIFYHDKTKIIENLCNLIVITLLEDSKSTHEIEIITRNIEENIKSPYCNKTISSEEVDIIDLYIKVKKESIIDRNNNSLLNTTKISEQNNLIANTTNIFQAAVLCTELLEKQKKISSRDIVCLEFSIYLYYKIERRINQLFLDNEAKNTNEFQSLFVNKSVELFSQLKSNDVKEIIPLRLKHYSNINHRDTYFSTSHYNRDMDGLLVMIFKSLSVNNIKSLKQAVDLPRDVYEILLKKPLMKIEKELIIPYLFNSSFSQETYKDDIPIPALIASEDSRVNNSTGLHFTENTQLMQLFILAAERITEDLFKAIENFYTKLSDYYKFDENMEIRFEIFNYLIVIVSFHLDFPKLPPRSSEHILKLLFAFSKKNIEYLDFFETISIEDIYTEISEMKKLARKYGLHDNKYFKESLFTLTESIYNATSDLDLDQSLQTLDRKKYNEINSQLSIIAKKITYEFGDNVMNKLAFIPCYSFLS